jgi:tRNA threonylcarbamoyladenosine biosynthesis protein TsaB
LNIIAIETSTEACSVALLRQDGVLFSEFAITPREHTRYLPEMLDLIFKQSGINRNKTNAVAYASGPGAFTGVRIAAATAQGLAIGLDTPLIPISTLAVLAQQTFDEQHDVDSVLTALDARMGETYCAHYMRKDQGLVELQGEEQLIKLDMLKLPDHVVGAGSGFSASREAGNEYGSSQIIFPDIYPTAAALVKLAKNAADKHQQVSVTQTHINYIRNKVAEKKTTPPGSF